MRLLNLLSLALFAWGFFVVMKKFGSLSKQQSGRAAQHNA